MTTIVVRLKDGTEVVIEAPEHGFDELNILTDLRKQKFIHIWGHYLACDNISYVKYK